jgi:thiamine pyrophosphate-dependent acetolactate synthase large subunit-like protein
MTTLGAVALFNGLAADLGVFGTLSSNAALEAIAAADCVVAFGASLNSYTTVDGGLLDGKRVIQVDVDARRIGVHRPVAVEVVGDAGRVARDMISLLDEAGVKTTGFADSVSMPRSLPPDADHVVSIPMTVDAFQRAAAGEFTVVIDAGRFMIQALRALRPPSPRHYVHTAHFASIGLSMGCAIGAARACEEPVLSISGDGGFMLGCMAEFATAVREKLNITAIVFNDGSYGAEHIQLVQRGMDPAISTFVWPDLAAVATALGGVGFTVSTPADLAEPERFVGLRIWPGSCCRLIALGDVLLVTVRIGCRLCGVSRE